MTSADVIVIGGGIAGIGAAARIAADRDVVVLEREAAVGSHATGRSAAMLLDTYGNDVIRALTAAGRRFFESPDDAEAWPGALLKRRGELFLGRPGEEDLVAGHGASGAQRLTPEEAVELVPILRREAVAAATYDPRAADIDVDLLLQGFVRLLRRSGGEIRTGARIDRIARQGDGWRVDTDAGHLAAPVLINAAGAWGDVVAADAGVAPIGLAPLRRSAALLPSPDGLDPAEWPLFGGIAEDWYAKPAGGKLMVSPADEDPVEPHDAWADDMVIAEGLDRYERMVTVPVTRVEASWAGLRSFVIDRTPVAGFDPQSPGFFWLVGQGGYGIQTAPALSQLAADLTAGRTPGLDPDIVAALSPGRLRGAA